MTAEERHLALDAILAHGMVTAGLRTTSRVDALVEHANKIRTDPEFEESEKLAAALDELLLEFAGACRVLTDLFQAHQPKASCDPMRQTIHLLLQWSHYQVVWQAYARRAAN